MNQLNAVIKSIETEENISMVTVEAMGISFSILVIDTPATAAYLEEGNEVIMVFKATAMSVAKNLSGGLSIRNRFPATIAAIENGKVLSSVLLDCKGVMLEAVITTRAAEGLGLQIGDA